MESILNSIKKLLGISEEYTHFDSDLIIHINSVLLSLKQIGVGPSSGFVVKDSDTKWFEFTDNILPLESVKSLVYLKVKLLFDPPANSTLIESIKSSISELEWRINVFVDELDDVR